VQILGIGLISKILRRGRFAIKALLSYRRTAQDALTSHDNSFNLIRLILSFGVLFWHSWDLLGAVRPVTSPIIQHALFGSTVNGFFIVSGFLVANAVRKNANLQIYALNRIFSIFPALFVTLVFTGFVLAPALAVITGVPLTWTKPFAYVLGNMFLFPMHWGIGGTLANTPIPVAWNGSLWTLPWQMLAYIFLWLFARWGRFNIKALWSFNLACAVSLAFAPIFVDLSQTWQLRMIQTDLCFGFIFSLGMLAATYATRVVFTWKTMGLALGILTLSVAFDVFMPIGSAALSFLLLALGTSSLSPKIIQKYDFSYGIYLYAFPVQQFLIGIGVASGDPRLFVLQSLAFTFPLAVLSRKFIERPAAKLVKPWVAAYLAKRKAVRQTQVD